MPGKKLVAARRVTGGRKVGESGGIGEVGEGPPGDRTCRHVGAMGEGWCGDRSWN